MKPKRIYFTVANAATYAGVNRRTIYNWIDAGILDAVILSGIRYVSRADMDNLIDEAEDDSNEDEE